MRIALLALAACATPARPVAPARPVHTCSDEWSELAEMRRGAWIPGAHVPVRIVDVAGSDVEVASVLWQAIVTRWVPFASLEPAAMRASEVSPTAGAPADPAIRIVKGHRLGAIANGWAQVIELDAPASIAGFVPASIVGTTWEEPEPEPDDDFVVAQIDTRPNTRPSDGPLVREPGGTITYRYRPRPKRDRRYLRYATGDVRVAPADDARVRIALRAPTVVQIRGLDNGWLAVTVLAPFAEIDGYWKLPPPEPPSDEGEIDMSTRVHSPIAAGTCLYDAPNGRVVGMVRDADTFATPRPSSVKGWWAATIPTAWGPTTYYIDAPPLAPPAPLPEETWPWPYTGEQW